MSICRSAIYIICLLGLTAVGASAIQVGYLSAENVYLNSGSADSLAVGDTLEIRHGEQAIAQVEIVFVSEHSASCRIIRADSAIAVGDSAVVIRHLAQTESAQTVIPAMDSSRTVATSSDEKKTAPLTLATPMARISGSVAVSQYYLNDAGPANYDFKQPGMRLNIRAGQLWGADLAFNLRLSSYYYQRARSFGGNVPQNDWRHRVYQASLGYGSSQSPLSFEMGRIVSNKISGIGYIDGLLAQKGFLPRMKLGLFVGVQPQWQYSSFQTSLQKYGTYLNYQSGDYATRLYESTLALAGEYHGGTVSREFIYLQNRAALGNAWNIFQSAELDINRDWRKQKSGQSLTLTNLYASVRGRLAPVVTAGLSFDGRKNYWSYDLRNLADSLFDDALRRGLRADISLGLPARINLFSGVGYNKRGGDSRTAYSYSAGINKSDFIIARAFANLQLAGYTNRYSNGANYSLRLGRYFRRGDSFSVGYGFYRYKIRQNGEQRANSFLQLNAQFDLIFETCFSGQFEIDRGDDTKGQRMMAELGYRF